MKIGFFDSGVGGLLVLKAVVKTLPQYDYVYYGDTANLPYGDKTEEEIYAHTKAAVEVLFQRNCQLVIVACNTASAETIRKLQDSYLREEHPDKRILGVIVPTVEAIIDGGYKRAILIATSRTISSGKYERELRKLSSHCELLSVATPKLVPLIESHQKEEALQGAIAAIETNSMPGDAIILGCTHYILLKDDLRRHFGEQYEILSQDEIVPEKLAEYLERHQEIATTLSNTGKRDIILSLHRPDYEALAAEFLGGVYIP